MGIWVSTGFQMFSKGFRGFERVSEGFTGFQVMLGFEFERV